MSDNNFSPKSISDLLSKDSQYHFEIPSFQRGYRWTSKQVKDLLKDLYSFTISTLPRDSEISVYYLQPLVIRGNGYHWQVLDGQQRLTTLKLIIEALKEYGRKSVQKINEYEIKYLIRPNFDFAKVESTRNLDSYFVSQARETIRQWIMEQKEDDLTDLADIIFGYNKSKKVKFIWYEVEGKDASDSSSIAIFNRLNRGKIKLTPSELIKALLIISADQVNENKDFQTVVSMEWNEIERQFLKNDFFSFINAGNKSFDTRTDLLFNYIATTNGMAQVDDDYAYRWFQKIYDEKGPAEILNIWNKEVKDIYDMLIQWYSDAEMYNLIGFLSSCGVKIDVIKNRLDEAKKSRKEAGGQWIKADNKNVLKNLIKEQFKPLSINDTIINFPNAIDELDYNYHYEYIKKVLFLFNIVTYSNLNLRFPFDIFFEEKWDLEHVDSQTANPLQRNEDQKKWLQYTLDIIDDYKANFPESIQIKRDIEKCLSDDIQSPQWISRFRDIYDRVSNMVANKDQVSDKDSIGNLTLLDAKTNRGYGNALFPYKRKKIIENEQNGRFVPICTKNLFLKYYTTGETQSSGLDRIIWTENDVTAQLNAIHKTLDPIFNN